MLIVEMWPVARLIPYARNPRRNDGAVGRMCSAIREFGFRIPVVARSDGTVVDGHLRLKAAQQLGLDEVPVALADDLSEAQIKAFRLLANRSAAWAAWDDALLTLELQDLQDVGYDLGLTGFDVAELCSLLDEAPATGLTDENVVPGTSVEPLTKPGDLIVLGPHRLLCGDATRADDVARLLDGARPQLMVTDPPYGVDYDPCWRNAAGVSTAKRTGRVANDDRADWREAWALFEGDVAYVWHAAIHARSKCMEMAGMLARCGVMTELDRDALARYAVIWCRWIDAEAEIKRKGPIVKTEAGNVIHSPYLAVANRCHRQLAQLESEFGLTPSSRSRVRAASPPVASDPLADRYFDF